MKHTLISNVFYTIKMLRKKDKFIILMFLLATVLEVMLSILEIIFPKYVLDLIDSDVKHVLIGITILAIVIGIGNAIYKYIKTKIDWHLISIQAEYLWDLYMKTLRCDYMMIESAEGQMTLEIL